MAILSLQVQRQSLSNLIPQASSARKVFLVGSADDTKSQFPFWLGYRWYRRYGLNIRSAVPVFGPPLAGQSGVSADLQVDWGASVAVCPGSRPEGELMAVRARPDGQPFSTLVKSGYGYTLRLHGIADFIMDESVSRVLCQPCPGAPEGLAQVMLQSVVLAFVLSLRGHLVLHSAAVTSGGRVLAIAGPPGSGKTTLAALLCAGGASLYSDDLIWLDGNGQAVGTGPSPELRLRPAAREVLSLFSPRPPSYETCDGRTAFCPLGGGPSGPATLSGVVLPLAAAEPCLSAHRLHGASTVRGLVSAARIAGWVDSAQQGRFFEGVVGLAGEVPIWQLRVPHGPPFRPIRPAELFDVLGGELEQAEASR